MAALPNSLLATLLSIVLLLSRNASGYVGFGSVTVMGGRRNRNSAGRVGPMIEPRARASGVVAPPCSLRAQENGGDAKAGGGIDQDLKTKLLAESIAPWRTVRLFLYGSFGSGALLGGFLTLTGLLAAKSNPNAEVDLSEQTINVLIDFGAVLTFAIAAYFDVKKGNELVDQVDEKIERKKNAKKQMAASNERWTKEFRALEVQLKLGQEGGERNVFVKDLLDSAKQNLVVIAGKKTFIKEALLSARLARGSPACFQEKNVLILPVTLDSSMPPSSSSSTASGFSAAPTIPATNTSPLYVAEPLGDEWKSLIESETKDAETQGGQGSLIRESGMVIVVGSDGKVKRRGVGDPKWNIVFEDIE